MKIFLRNTLILFCLFFLKSILAHENFALRLFQDLTNQERWKMWENNALFWQSFTQGLRCQVNGRRMGRLLEVFSCPSHWRFILETLGGLEIYGDTFFETESLMWQKFCDDISQLKVADFPQQSQGNCMIDLALRLFDSRIEEMQNFFKLCHVNWNQRIVPAAGFLCITLEEHFNNWAVWHKFNALNPDQELLNDVITTLQDFRDDLKCVADQAKNAKVTA